MEGYLSGLKLPNRCGFPTKSYLKKKIHWEKLCCYSPCCVLKWPACRMSGLLVVLKVLLCFYSKFQHADCRRLPPIARLLASEDVSFMNHLESFECLNTRIPCVFATGWKDSKNEAEKDIWKYKVRVFLTLVCFTGII